MRPYGLFAIFCKDSFCNGVKTVAYVLLYFQEKQTWGRRWSGRRWLDHLKASHVFGATDHFAFIMFVNYYMLNALGMAQWHTRRLVTYMTWVRAPGLHPFHMFFFQLTFTCSFSLRDTPYAPPSSRPYVQHHQSKGGELRNMMHLVNASTRE